LDVSDLIFTLFAYLALGIFLMALLRLNSTCGADSSGAFDDFIENLRPVITHILLLLFLDEGFELPLVPFDDPILVGIVSLK